MAALQYVGARYVPKLFDDGKGGMEWQPGTYYEPLTIVTYNNASYISRVPVAATIGNPPSNRDCWAMTGSYNGFISQLQESIQAIEDDLQDHILFIGDSYSYNTQLPERVASEMGLKLYKKAAGGMGYVSQVSGQVFGDQLRIADEAARNKCRYVVCYGGINDLNVSDEAFTSAVLAFITTAKSLYPKSTIVLIGIQSSTTSYYSVKTKTKNTILSSLSVNNGVSYVDASMWLLNGPNTYLNYYGSDLLHPSSLGIDLLVSRIVSSLAGGETGSSATVAGVSAGWNVQVQGSKKHLQIQGLNTTSLTLKEGYNQIAEISNGSLLIPTAFITPLYQVNPQNPTGIVGAVCFRNGVLQAVAFSEVTGGFMFCGNVLTEPFAQ